MSDDPTGSASDGPAPSEERTLPPIRRTIANRLQESYRNAVHVTVTRELDAEALFAARDAVRERTADDVDVALPDVLLCALSATLAEHPAFNATFEDGTHALYDDHEIAVAVDTDAGLVTPVLSGVGERTVPEIAAERRRLTALVRAGDHSMSDLQGSTFTVTNLGVLGVDSFTPVINPPEVAILGIDRVRERVVPDDGDVAVRRRLNVDLTFDHRPVDGADAARFLTTLANRVEHAEELTDAALE